MIKSLVVEGLQNRISRNFIFNEDLNILTGVNGSGKTTLLKLIWFLISGNIERIYPEIEFKSVSINTDSFKLTIENIDRTKQSITFIDNENSTIGPQKGNIKVKDEYKYELINNFNRLVIAKIKYSLIFPTFRRIEGGFSLDDSTSFRARTFRNEIIDTNDNGFLQTLLERYSNNISVQHHRIITSISTNDIVELLTKEYAKSAEEINSKYTEFSNSIIKTITGTSLKTKKDPRSLLEDIKNEAIKIMKEKSQIFQKYEKLSEIISVVFPNKKIKIGGALMLGSAKNPIESTKLSAGEKQMLSFLTYNAYYENCPIFIDEPELSLHIDWQRQLLGFLLNQESHNQYFIATHSPAIYAKYSDKEIEL